MITVKQNLHFDRSQRGRRRIATEAPRERPPVAPRVPRIARLMALAIHFDGLLRAGEAADITTLARLSHVTQPRMTQILALNHLAPEIQDELLHLIACETGKEPIHEKGLRRISAEYDWQCQRKMWAEVKLLAGARH
jgi:hypothetical protein